MLAKFTCDTRSALVTLAVVLVDNTECEFSQRHAAKNERGKYAVNNTSERCGARGRESEALFMDVGHRACSKVVLLCCNRVASGYHVAPCHRPRPTILFFSPFTTKSK